MSRAADGQRELLQKFKVQKFLGKGSYGSVYRIKKLQTGTCSDVDSSQRGSACAQWRTFTPLKNKLINM